MMAQQQFNNTNNNQKKRIEKKNECKLWQQICNLARNAMPRALKAKERKHAN